LIGSAESAALIGSAESAALIGSAESAALIGSAESADPEISVSELRASVIGSPGLADCCMRDNLLAGWC
jgi:hypothetical protein